jgi:hypothetical protein
VEGLEEAVVLQDAERLGERPLGIDLDAVARLVVSGEIEQKGVPGRA